MEAIKTSNTDSRKISDYDLVKRILLGEKELFEILLRRCNQTLYRAIRSYIQYEDDIEDVMQDTYLNAYQKLNQFNGNSAFSTWLIRIGVNEALQRIRKNKRNQIISINDQNIMLDKINQLTDSHQMNPEKQVEHYETRVLVEKAIDQLPPKYRAIYVLREVEGMENAEIAACLNLSDSNVKVRLHRAKSLLKETLYKLSSNAHVFKFGHKRCDKLVEIIMKKI